MIYISYYKLFFGKKLQKIPDTQRIRQNIATLSQIFFFTISYPCMIEKVLALGEIFEVEILIDLHSLKFPHSKNHTFSFFQILLYT